MATEPSTATMGQSRERETVTSRQGTSNGTTGVGTSNPENSTSR
jgi:hypothetical protein